MTIRVDCEQCGEKTSVSNRAAGKKLRCRCGGVISVPDDAGDESGQVVLRSRHRNSKKRQTEITTKWILIGGGAVLGLIILFLLAKSIFSPIGKNTVPLMAQNSGVHAGASTIVPLRTNTVPPPISTEPSRTDTRGTEIQSRNDPRRANSQTSSTLKSGGSQTGGDSRTSAKTNPTSPDRAKSGFKRSASGTPKPGFPSSDWGGDSKSATPAASEKPSSQAGRNAEWGNSAEIVAQTEGSDTTIEFPATDSHFALVGKAVYDIRTAEQIGTFPISSKAANGQYRALSPDGKLLAGATNEVIDTAELVTLNELGGKGFGKILKTNDIGRAKENMRVQFIKFSSPNRLLVGVDKLGGRTSNRILVFNTETGKVAKEIQCGEIAPSATLTSDGRYLAMFTRNEIPVFDVQKGQKAASMEIPASDSQSRVFRNPGTCHGLAFSPDASELAALLDGNRLVVWSSKGKIIYDEILARPVSDLWSGDKGGVVWLPDQSGWILGKQYLFDREKKMLLWRLQRSDSRNELPIKMVDQENVLAHVGDGRSGELAKIPIPWSEIQQSLGGENWESLALVKPGEAMSIKVEVYNVRFAQPQEVANAMGTALTQRIERSKFKVAPDRPVILKAIYNEEQGDNKRVVESNRFNPFGGRDTGMTVNDTKGKLEIKIITRDKEEVVWEQTITSDGGSSIKGDVSDANVRKQMFEYLSYRVNQLALPTMIPKPGGPLLPIVTDKRR